MLGYNMEKIAKQYAYDQFLYAKSFIESEMKYLDFPKEEMVSRCNKFRAAANAYASISFFHFGKLEEKKDGGFFCSTAMDFDPECENHYEKYWDFIEEQENWITNQYCDWLERKRKSGKDVAESI